jgi:hypothetical protein
MERHWRRPNWDDIAYFVVNGRPAPTSNLTEVKHRQYLVVGLGWVAPAVWVIAVTLVVLGGMGIWSLPIREGAKTFSLVIYAMTIWRVLTWL